MPMKFGTSIGIGYALAHVTLLALRHHVTQRSSSHWARTHAHTRTHTLRYYEVCECAFSYIAWVLTVTQSTRTRTWRRLLLIAARERLFASRLRNLPRIAASTTTLSP